MTSPRRPGRRSGVPGPGVPRSGGPATFRLQPVAVIGAAVVLAVFVVGVVVGGVLGGALIAVLAIGAGVLLQNRWSVLDPRIRTFRLVVVLIVLVVAIIVMVRG